MTPTNPTRSKDDGPFWETILGVAGERFQSSDQSGAPADITDTPPGNKQIVITDLIVSADTDMELIFTDGVSGAVLADIFLISGTVPQITPRSPIVLPTAGSPMQVQSDVAGEIRITTLYYYR